MMRTSVLVCGLIYSSAGIAQAGIVTLDASMTVDNSFTASISSDPNLAGDQFLSGGNWPSTYTGTFDFESPGTYYLHVHAHDAGSPEMFIGLFTLSNQDASFSNGTQRLITQAQSDWSASISGFGGADVGLSDRGANGQSPWGFYSAMEDARFIWGDTSRDDVYFSTVITVVPAPSSLGMLCVCGLAGARRRR